MAVIITSTDATAEKGSHKAPLVVVYIHLGDRWRRSHGAFEDQLYIDGRLLGINTQNKVCGLFTHCHSEEGR